MERKTTILSAFCFLGSLSVAVVAIAANVGLRTEPGKPAMASDDYTISFSSGSNVLTGSPGNQQNVLTSMGNPITFSYGGYSQYSGAWGSLAANGHLENTTPLGGLTKLSVTYWGATGNLAISYGWWDASTNSIAYEVTDSLITSASPSFDFDKYSPSFFKITAANTAQIASITVKYNCVVTEDPLPTVGNLKMSLSGGAYSVALCNTTAPFAIIIPSTYKGLPVTGIENKAFSGCSVKSVTIPSSITSIGTEVFSSCTSLTSVTIPSSITSIGMNAFSSCIKLASVTIPSSVTTIGNAAFSACYSLTSVVVPSSVTSVGINAFYKCTSLTSATIDSTANIGGGMFYGCTSLTSITIASSTIGDSSFYGCSSLTSIVIPSSVTSIGSYAFYKCTSLTSIVIPSSVTTIGGSAFRSCTKLSISCEVSSKPSGWSTDWNQDNLPVTWGYRA